MYTFTYMKKGLKRSGTYVVRVLLLTFLKSEFDKIFQYRIFIHFYFMYSIILYTIYVLRIGTYKKINKSIQYLY